VAIVVHSTVLESAVTGGVLPRAVPVTPTTGTWATIIMACIITTITRLVVCQLGA
jgi:hypothetical protein